MTVALLLLIWFWPEWVTVMYRLRENRPRDMFPILGSCHENKKITFAAKDIYYKPKRKNS